MFLLLFWAGFSADHASALGLGNIEVKASKGKTLTAEIPVITDPGETELKAEVGTPLDYQMMQIKRPDFMDNLVVKIKNDPSNPARQRILVYSDKPVPESTFNLVIKASSGNGTIMENFFLAMNFRKSLSLELPGDETIADAGKKPLPLEDRPPIKVSTLPPKISNALVRKNPAQYSGVEKRERSRVIHEGDTLLAIIRSLDIPVSIRPHVALALYNNNKHAFIDENIHKLKVGETISYENIESKAAQYTFMEAKVVLDAHLEKLKARPDPRDFEADVPLARFIPDGEVLKFIDRWKADWKGKDEEALANYYSTDFNDSRGLGRDDFLGRRIAFNRNKTNIEIEIENPAIKREGDLVKVHFKQWFQSDTFASFGLKKMMIKDTSNGLKIASEDFIPKKSEDNKRPWVVYLGYSTEAEKTKSGIERLRAAGFEAYEASSYIFPSKGFRTIIGRAKSRSEAEEIARNLKGLGKKFTKVLEFPFALEANLSAERADAEFVYNKLREYGYSPYLLEKSYLGKTRYGVYLGAFASREKALEAYNNIRENEFSFKILTP
ncbi:MAG: SPOR domain-containing protein [Nitrospinota bacterium]|nr:SPOR domain-containing protein [Nitrospinota bacterium]